MCVLGLFTAVLTTANCLLVLGVAVPVVSVALFPGFLPINCLKVFLSCFFPFGVLL